MRILSFILLVFLCFSCTTKQKVNLESLLREMSDPSSLSRFPDPAYNLHQASSYDRRTVHPDSAGWFANSDRSWFVREEQHEGRREMVLMEDHGPGAVVRWWMTFAGEGATEGTLRVYIDQEPKPVIEGPVLDILSGQALCGAPLSSSVSPETTPGQRGHNLYLPIPYSSHLKITYECDALVLDGERSSPAIYYNINYRKYQNGTKVESFSQEQLAAAGERIRQVNAYLSAAPDAEQYSENTGSFRGSIPVGDSLLFSVGGPGAIDYLSLKLIAGDLPQALRSTLLVMQFDGKETVRVPVAAFFGAGYLPKPFHTRYTSYTSDGSFHATFYMPYKKEAILYLLNDGQENVKLEEGLYHRTSHKWKRHDLYFHAGWKEYRHIKAAGHPAVGGSGLHEDLTLAALDGKGVYAGDAITVFNTVDAWWGEGDEKIWVDGEDFPAHIGTGTEDYYGYAWCRPEPFNHPYISQPRGEGNFHPGLSVNMRFRGLDAIPFEQQIRADMELWHWAPAVINYGISTWWYANVQSRRTDSIPPEGHLYKVALSKSDIIPPSVKNDSLEGENLEVFFVTGGETETQYITEWDWSDEAQLWWKNGRPGDTATFVFILPEAGKYRVQARMSQAVDYGMVKLLIDRQTVFPRFNGYTAEGVKTLPLELGTLRLGEGKHLFELVLLGKDPRARAGYMAGIDLITFTPTE